MNAKKVLSDTNTLQYKGRVEVVRRLEEYVSLLRKNDILMNREFNLGF